MLQGRRDFVFDNTQAIQAFNRLKGPKLLYFGDHGHAPSTFPAADTDYAMTLSRRWFDRFLKGAGERRRHRRRRCSSRPTRGRGRRSSFAALAADAHADLPAAPASARTLGYEDHLTRVAGRTTIKLEDFGAPAVTGRRDRRRRLEPPGRASSSRRHAPGKTIVVSGGAVPTSAGKRTYTIRMLSQVTAIPAGSTPERDLRQLDLEHAGRPPLPRPAARRLAEADDRRGDAEAPRPPEAGLVRLAALALAALALRRRRRRRAERRPGRLVEHDPDRRHRPAQRPGDRLRGRRLRRGGLLQVRERPRRRVRTEDRLPLPRRRLRPRADRAADAAPRRAGQGLPDVQPGRHRADARDPAVPEPAEGAAALRRERHRAVRAGTTSSTRGRCRTCRASTRRARSTAATSHARGRGRRSPSSSRTATSARTSSPA